MPMMKLQPCDEKLPESVGGGGVTVPASLRLIDLRQVAAALSMSQRTVLRLVQRGQFPAPLRIGGRMLRWRVDVIEQWLNGRVQFSTGRGA